MPLGLYRYGWKDLREGWHLSMMNEQQVYRVNVIIGHFNYCLVIYIIGHFLFYLLDLILVNTRLDSAYKIISFTSISKMVRTMDSHA